ncbi:MAG: hypothetical protein RO257_06190 [Candidatus Kapabacteria bacterium]|nr:hypothetical protein [Candidatus Kapabacteria bacterium]
MKIFKIISLLSILGFVFLISCSEKSEPSKSEDVTVKDSSGIKFSGYHWVTKETKNIEDTRYFCLTNSSNVKVDTQGNLILKIRKTGDGWSGGEITLDTILGFGEYSFDIKSKSGSLDANATVAFTVLNITDDFFEGMTQTGIRFSKYSEPEASNELEYFLYATDKKFAEVESPQSPFKLTGLVSKHKVGIYPDYLYYSSKAEGYNSEFKAFKNVGSESDITDALTFSEPSDNLKVIISLCLPESNEPTDKKEVEVIISNFRFTPFVPDITKGQ